MNLIVFYNVKQIKEWNISDVDQVLFATQVKFCINLFSGLLVIEVLS